MNVEVEIRSFISKEKYERLLDFFKENAKLIEEDNQESYYFNCEKDLRTQRDSKGCKIWMKEGNIHDELREEVEVRFDRKDFEKVNEIFIRLGYGVEIKWFRKRYRFDWEGINVSLDYTKGYGYILELEKMSGENGNDEILYLLKSKLKEIDVEETSKEEFNKKFDYYKNNWRELIK